MAKNTSPNGPTPPPEIGDEVIYIWPPEGGNKLGGKALAAKVTAIHDGFDGRLVDLDVDTGSGIVPVKSAPWRDDEAGNTWHQL